jgi:hypothetical protein
MYMFVILCIPKYEVFELDVLHVCEIDSWIYLMFSIFLELTNIIFDFKKDQ